MLSLGNESSIEDFITALATTLDGEFFGQFSKCMDIHILEAHKTLGSLDELLGTLDTLSSESQDQLKDNKQALLDAKIYIEIILPSEKVFSMQVFSTVIADDVLREAHRQATTLAKYTEWFSQNPKQTKDSHSRGIRLYIERIITDLMREPRRKANEIKELIMVSRNIIKKNVLYTKNKKTSDGRDLSRVAPLAIPRLVPANTNSLVPAEDRVSKRIEKMRIRLTNLLDKKRKIPDPEMQNMLAVIDSIEDHETGLREQKIEILELIRKIRESQGIILESPGTNTTDGVMQPPSLKNEDIIVPSLIPDIQVQEVISYIGRLRTFMDNPSSTNHTKQKTIGDGSFWYGAVSPWLDYMSKLLGQGIFAIGDFSWQEVAEKHSNEVQIRNTKSELSILRESLKHFKQKGDIYKNIEEFSKVFTLLRGKGRFKSPDSLQYIQGRWNEFIKENPPPSR